MEEEQEMRICEERMREEREEQRQKELAEGWCLTGPVGKPDTSQTYL
jgi:hypothetical protein